MIKTFKITKNDFKKRNIIIASLVIIWLTLAFVQIKFYFFNSTFLGVIILLIIIGIGIFANVIRTYQVIGELIISTTEIQIKIGNKKDIVKIENGGYDYIKFYYKAFNGDQAASALVGFGTFYFYNGDGNTFEISSCGHIYNFDVKINNIKEFKILKQLLIQINDIGQNVIALKK
jgi:hypothetical protein